MKEESSNGFKAGDKVRIIRGKSSGKLGTVLWTRGKLIRILLDDSREFLYYTKDIEMATGDESSWSSLWDDGDEDDT